MSERGQEWIVPLKNKIKITRRTFKGKKKINTIIINKQLEQLSNAIAIKIMEAIKNDR